jgi:hypothetical protein
MGTMNRSTKRLSRSNWPRRGVAAAVAGSLALTACGGATDGSARTAGSKTATDDGRFQEAALQHAQCMRRNGVDVPDPRPGGGTILIGPGREGGSPAELRAAQKKCERYLAEVAPSKPNDFERNEMRDAALRHARCMRAQGVAFPDPKFDKSGGITVEIGPQTNPSNPEVRRAEAACRKELPGAGAFDEAEVPR